MFPTLDDAKRAAESEAGKSFMDHVYVYEFGGEFGVFWHFEDRYLTGRIPLSASVKLHGKIQHDTQLQRSITWEQRGSQFTQDDRSVLADQLGEDKADAILGLFDKDSD